MKIKPRNTIEIDATPKNPEACMLYNAIRNITPINPLINILKNPRYSFT
ncbi:MAG TPA: hypothetical protein VIO58_02590 [Candidatus Methanoperedens sp.]